MTALSNIPASQVAHSLGYDNPQDIYELIISHIDELIVLGDVRVLQNSDEQEEIYINSDHAKLLTLLSPGPLAAIFRHNIITKVDFTGGKYAH